MLPDTSKHWVSHSHDVGQPYAFKQAGMVTGILLLVFLTVVVCSTKVEALSFRLT